MPVLLVLCLLMPGPVRAADGPSVYLLPIGERWNFSDSDERGRMERMRVYFSPAFDPADRQLLAALVPALHRGERFFWYRLVGPVTERRMDACPRVFRDGDGTCRVALDHLQVHYRPTKRLARQPVPWVDRFSALEQLHAALAPWPGASVRLCTRRAGSCVIVFRARAAAPSATGDDAPVVGDRSSEQGHPDRYAVVPGQRGDAPARPAPGGRDPAGANTSSPPVAIPRVPGCREQARRLGNPDRNLGCLVFDNAAFIGTDPVCDLFDFGIPGARVRRQVLVPSRTEILIDGRPLAGSGNSDDSIICYAIADPRTAERLRLDGQAVMSYQDRSATWCPDYRACSRSD